MPQHPTSLCWLGWLAALSKQVSNSATVLMKQHLLSLTDTALFHLNFCDKPVNINPITKTPLPPKKWSYLTNKYCEYPHLIYYQTIFAYLATFILHLKLYVLITFLHENSNEFCASTYINVLHVALAHNLTIAWFKTKFVTFVLWLEIKKKIRTENFSRTTDQYGKNKEWMLFIKLYKKRQTYFICIWFSIVHS